MTVSLACLWWTLSACEGCHELNSAEQLEQSEQQHGLPKTDGFYICTRCEEAACISERSGQAPAVLARALVPCEGPVMYSDVRIII